MPALALHCPLLSPQHSLASSTSSTTSPNYSLDAWKLTEGKDEDTLSSLKPHLTRIPPLRFFYSPATKNARNIFLCCFFTSKNPDYTHYHISLVTNPFIWFSSIIDYIACLYTVLEAQENNVAQSSIHHA